MSFISPLSYLLFFGAVLLFVYTMAAGSRRISVPEKTGADEFEIPEAAKFILAFKPLYRLFLPLVESLPMPDYKSRMDRYAVTAGIEGQVNGNDMIGFSDDAYDTVYPDRVLLF